MCRTLHASSGVRREQRRSRPAQGPAEVPSGPTPGSSRGPQKQITIIRRREALLAFQPDEVIGQVCRLGLSRFTPQTITDPRILRRELAQVRKQGYAIDNSEHHADVRCIAAPIRNHAGEVIASLSVSGPATRITKDRIAPLATRVREVALKLSARLGYTGR